MTKKIICIDASFIIRLAISGTEVPSFSNLWTEWELQGYSKIAPTLFYYEVTNAFHRYVISDLLTSEEATEALEYILNLEIILHGNASLHRRALSLAQNLTLPAAYDAHYLALAEQLSADFYTADTRLFNAVKNFFPWVYLVG
ncbi:type II toxin-antitoxin system VapC family toxin [Dapis sp. BLCC M229]|uniref:type II toxin-antitoxin system VapC family toxin n=1 Tax=Dapis sp. BLCC M229 TaxID=3400188 RepID=UPI003CEE22B1